MIGREGEQRRLDALQRLLIEQSKGSIAIVDGEPGIGKSRLVAALREGAKTKDMTTYIGTALDIERSTPYFAWRGVFRALFPVEGSDGDSLQTVDLGNHLPNLLEKHGLSAELAPLLNPVLATELSDNELTSQLTQEARVTMTNDLLRRLLKIEAGLHSVQIILEDCHWMDSASWTLTRMVAESADDFLLFIVTRPLGDKPPGDYLRIQKQKNITRISLAPLSEDDVETLVCRSLGANELPRQVADLIRAKAQGNPLFGEELAFALRDAGAIEIAGGRCVLTSDSDLSNLGFPDTVQGVVTSRIDRLVPGEQLTLKVASVVGRSFSCRILKDMFPVEEDRPLQPASFQALTRRDLITAHDLDNEHDYQFRHVITQEVAYDLIPPTQRQTLHRSIAEWYEREHGEDLAPFFALLAKHWSRTDQTAKALEYLEKSGESAARQFANAEVIQFFRQAMEIDDAGGELVPLEQRTQWERQVAEACYNIGDLAASLEHFRSALDRLGFPFSQNRAGTIASTLLEFGKQCGLGWLLRLLPRRPANHPARLLQAAQCYERLAQIHYLNNARLPTIHAVFKALNLADAVGPSSVLARCYANAAVVAGLLMLHRRARLYAERAHQVAAEVNDPDCTSYVGLIVGIYWATVGEWDAADEIVTRAMALAEGIGARRRWAESTYTYVICSWRRGELARCEKYAGEMLKAGRRDRMPQIQLWGLTWRLRCLLARSQDADPIRELAEELQECLKHNDITPADQILGQGMLGEALWRLGEKRAAFEEAERTSTVIAESNQISHFVLPAYSAIFMIYHGLWSEETDPEQRQNLERRIKAVRRSLWEFGVMYPVGRVRSGLHEGQFHQQQGRRKKAVRCWNKALRLAKKFRMPFEEGLLHLELAEGLPDEDPDRILHRLDARECFQRTGAQVYQSRVDRLESSSADDSSFPRRDLRAEDRAPETVGGRVIPRGGAFIGADAQFIDRLDGDQTRRSMS